MAEFRLPEPRLPQAPGRYTEQAEASFRAGLLRYLRDIRDMIQLGNEFNESGFAPFEHSHVEADITDLGNYAVVGHSHVEADITDLGNYAVVGHSHVEADITDLGNYPELDQTETITGAWTFTNYVKVTPAVSTMIRMWDSTVAANSRAWDIRAESGKLAVRAITDAGSTTAHALTVERTGLFKALKSLQVPSDQTIVVGTDTKKGSVPDGVALEATFDAFSDGDPTILGYMDVSAAAAGTVIAMEGFGIASHSTGTVNSLLGVAGNCQLVGNGTVTAMRGVQGGVGIFSGTGTITSAIALYAAAPYDIGGMGTITTAYGLYVVDQTAGSTNYAIYTEGGWVRLGGLPTSSAGLPAGTLWNDSGTVKVA